MHDEWVQVLEQMLQAAYKILFYDLNDFDQEILHQFTTASVADSVSKRIKCPDVEHEAEAGQRRRVV